jgi:hypothetical protein
MSASPHPALPCRRRPCPAPGPRPRPWPTLPEMTRVQLARQVARLLRRVRDEGGRHADQAR